MYLSPRAAEKHLSQLGVDSPSYETIRLLMKEGRIQHHRFQRYWMVDVEDLIRYLQEANYVKAKRLRRRVVTPRRRRSRTCPRYLPPG